MVVWIEKVTNFECGRKSFFLKKEIDYLYTEADMKDWKKNQDLCICFFRLSGQAAEFLQNVVKIYSWG